MRRYLQDKPLSHCNDQSGCLTALTNQGAAQHCGDEAIPQKKTISLSSCSDLNLSGSAGGGGYWPGCGGGLASNKSVERISDRKICEELSTEFVTPL